MNQVRFTISGRQPLQLSRKASCQHVYDPAHQQAVTVQSEHNGSTCSCSVYGYAKQDTRRKVAVRTKACAVVLISSALLPPTTETCQTRRQYFTQLGKLKVGPPAAQKPHGPFHNATNLYLYSLYFSPK
ncbi:uncharacterized protein [Dermacentor andersoni]|uniref:uncharacterized protein isoform X1 n=1 Tax=Dermacentor andersoni TaxID=34620 RepID=UPI003B3B87D8